VLKAFSNLGSGSLENAERSLSLINNIRGSFSNWLIIKNYEKEKVRKMVFKFSTV